METRGQKMNHSELAVQVVISDIRSEIDLDGKELLKFASWLPGTRVMCTTGTLWLTQQGDLHDHFLKAGQSFTLYQGGTVLVQGLPCGKAVILESGKEPSYNKNGCSGQWEVPLAIE